MPRYDDRLDNVLELKGSGEHSNSDTIFRHISDILLQESAWMAPERRAEVVYHLADIYPKTTQSARMEVMDIAARVQDAAPELIAIAAADSSIVGTRLWDRVSLPREDWPKMLKRLSKPVLGRLRARLDLPDETTVAIDREWRERVKNTGYLSPSLMDTLEELKSRRTVLDTAPLSAAGSAPASTPAPHTPGDSILERAANKAEAADTVSVPTDASQDMPSDGPTDGLNKPDDIFDLNETAQNDPPAPEEGSGLLFVPSEDDASVNMASNLKEALSARNEPEEEAGPIDVSDLLESVTPQTQKSADHETDGTLDATDETTREEEDIDESAAAKVIALSDHRAAEELEDIDDLEAAETEDTRKDDAAFALSESPQVEDPKIQDILERLREFGSRSKRAAERQSQTSEDMASLAALVGGQDIQDETETAAPAEAERVRGASLFLPDQPDDPLQPAQDSEIDASDSVRPSLAEDDLQATERDPAMHEEDDLAKPRAVSVNGTTWVTDRLGTLVECTTPHQHAFGVTLNALDGQILSSLFVAEDQRALDRALNSRSAFRDLNLHANEDQTVWMVSAIPVFDDMTGLFLGHRGTATHISIVQQPGKNKAAATAPQPPQPPVLDVEGLAHELKTPLNAIRGFAEMIETEQLGPASAFARNRSQKIGQEADQLHHVITDLLLHKTRQQGITGSLNPLRANLKDALEPFANHLMIEGISSLPHMLKTRMEPALMDALIEKVVHAGAQWTPASRPVKIHINQDEHATVTLQAALPGWMGGASQRDLDTLSDGPRLSYRHPLLTKSFKGRGLSAILSDIEKAGGRLFLRSAGRLDASLVLVIPVNTSEA